MFVAETPLPKIGLLHRQQWVLRTILLLWNAK